MSGPGQPAIIEGTILNSALYQSILEEMVWSSICELKLKCNWVIHQYNDPKHKSKSISEWLKRNKIFFWSGLVKVLEPNSDAAQNEPAKKTIFLNLRSFTTPASCKCWTRAFSALATA